MKVIWASAAEQDAAPKTDQASELEQPPESISTPVLSTPALPPGTQPALPTEFVSTPVASAPDAAASTNSASIDSVTVVAGASAGVTMAVVRPPTQADVGFVSVSVPKSTATEGMGFRIPLPLAVAGILNAAANGQSTNATDSSLLSPGMANIELRAVVDGRSIPLPSWLRYLPEQQTFEALAVPDGGLPITIEITVGGQRTLMVISERPN